MDVFAKRRAALASMGRPVTDAASTAIEGKRIAKLPVTKGDDYYVLDFPRAYERPGCTLTLRRVQRNALACIHVAGGGLLPIGVGHGKTLIGLLSGAVLGADLAVVFVQPKTIDYVRETLQEVERNYFVPETHVVSWGALSQRDAHVFLDWLSQQVLSGRKVSVFADEAHNLRNFDAARTRRLMNWLNAHPNVPFVAASGTLTTRRLADYGHLAERALASCSPVPRGKELAVWDRVFAREAQSAADLASVQPLWEWAGNTDKLAFPLSDDQHKRLCVSLGARLATCPGVVLTQDQSCAASLYIVRWNLETTATKNLWKRAEEVARTYRDPNGDVLGDDTDVARAARRLVFGYYYRWEWDGEVDHEWLEARAEWAGKVRWLIEKYGRPGFDTRGLIESEAARRLREQSAEPWVQTYAAWKAVEKRANPRPVAVWVDDSVVRAIAQKAREEGPCIVWYDEDAMADALQAQGILVKRAGEDPPKFAETVALSLRSHGVGLNLQAWSKQIFACVPAGGGVWEQTLGRTHRQGQQADEVWAWVPQWAGNLRQALKTAREDAEWIERSTLNPQKLIAATFV